MVRDESCHMAWQARRPGGSGPGSVDSGAEGPDSVIDAVGMEAHGSPRARFMLQMATLLPDPVAATLTKTVGWRGEDPPQAVGS
jgi:hypothetical protein